VTGVQTCALPISTNTTLLYTDNSSQYVVKVGFTDSDWRYSTNTGSSYSTLTLPNNAEILSVQYVGGRWFVRSYSTIYSGTSITSLTACDIPVGTFARNKFVYGSSKWLTMYQGQSLVSTDGVNFTAYNIADTEGQNAKLYYTVQNGSTFSNFGTVDFWYYASGLAYGKIHFGTPELFSINLNESFIEILVNDNRTNVSSALTANQWNHIRIVKSGTNLSIYSNGTRRFNSTASFTQTGLFLEGPLILDELLVTDDLLTDPSMTSLTPPSGPYQNTANTKLLLHFDGTFEDDVSIIQLAEATLTANVSITAVGSRTLDSQANLSSASNVTAEITVLIDSAATLSSQGFVMAVVAKKVDELAELTATTSLTANAGKSIENISELDCQSNINAAATRIQQAESAITGAFNAVVEATQFEGLAALTLTAPASLSAKGSYSNAGIVSNINSSITVSATGFEAPKDPQPVLLPFEFNLYHLNSQPNGVWLEEYTQTYVDIGGISIDDLDYPLDSQGKFGTDSAYSLYTPYPASFGVYQRFGDYDSDTRTGITLPIQSAFDGFTIDLWVSPLRNEETEIFKVFFTDGFDQLEGYRLYMTPGAGQITFRVSGHRSESSAYSTTVTGYTDNGPIPGPNKQPYRFIQWTHVALQRSGNTISFWVNGIKKFEFNETINLNNFDRYRLDGRVRIGWNYSTSQGQNPNGWYAEELRLSGKAQYTSDFTPPIAEYPTVYEYFVEKNGYALLEPRFSLAILVTENAQANITANSTVTATGSRIRTISSSQSSNINLISTIGKLAGITANLSTAFTQTSSGARTRTTDSNMSVESTVSVTGDRIRFADSQIESTLSVEAQGDRSRTVNAGLQASSDITETSTRIRYADTSFDSIATQLAAVGYNATGTVLLESRFESTVTVVKTTDVVSDNSIAVEFTVINDRFRGIDTAIEAEFTQSAEALNIRPAGSSMEVFASLAVNTDNSKIAGIDAAVSSEFTQNTINDTIRFGIVSVNSEFTATATAFRIEQAHADLTSESTIEILTGIRADARADLPAIATQLAVGDVINIDLFYQIKVPQETRQGTILPESRVIQVEQETRLNMIL